MSHIRGREDMGVCLPYFLDVCHFRLGRGCYFSCDYHLPSILGFLFLDHQSSIILECASPASASDISSHPTRSFHPLHYSHTTSAHNSRLHPMSHVDPPTSIVDFEANRGIDDYKCSDMHLDHLMHHPSSLEGRGRGRGRGMCC